MPKKWILWAKVEISLPHLPVKRHLTFIPRGKDVFHEENNEFKVES